MKKKVSVAKPKKMIGGTDGNTVAANVNQAPHGAYIGHGAFIDEISNNRPLRFFEIAAEAASKTHVRYWGDQIEIEEALHIMRTHFGLSHSKKRKVIFIGNGGSGAIASHMAVDFSKNGGIRAVAFNDAPTLLCLANDFGFEHVFSKQLEWHAQSGDKVVIISSSGKSPNILAAANQARVMGLDLITMSGQNPANALRRLGMMQFYVPAMDYGIVELAHLMLLHSVVEGKK